MTHVILQLQNGDFVAEFSSRADAERELVHLATADPSAGDTLGILAFDDRGQPVGEIVPASDCLRQPAY